MGAPTRVGVEPLRLATGCIDTAVREGGALKISVGDGSWLRVTGGEYWRWRARYSVSWCTWLRLLTATEGRGRVNVGWGAQWM